MKKIIIFILLLLTVNIFSIDINEIYNNASSLLQSGDYQKAIEEYKKLLSSDDNTIKSNGYFYIGYCYQIQNLNDEAVKNYELSLKLNDKNVFTLDYLGTLLLTTGINYDKGHDCLLKSYKNNSTNQVTYYNLSWYYISQKGDLQNGMKFFELAMYYNSTNIENLKQNILWPQNDVSMSLLANSDFYKKLIANQDSLISGLNFFFAGYNLQTNKDYENAILNYTKSIDNLNLSINDDSFIHAIIYNFAGETYRLLKKNNEAMDFQNKALDIYTKRFDELNMLIGTTYNYIGSIYTDTKEYEKAYEFYTKSYDTYSKVYDENNDIMAGAFYKLGETRYFLKEYKDALPFLEKALSIRQRINTDNSLLAETYYMLGEVYLNLENTDQALMYHNKSLEIYDTIKDNDKILSAYSKLTEIYEQLHDYKKAIEFSKKSLEINKDKSTEGEAVALANIGYFYLQNNEYKIAMDYLLKALLIFNKLNINNENLANTYYNISSCYQKNGDYNNSLAYSLLCLDIRKDILNKDDNIIANTNNLIGSNYENIYQLDKANDYYLKALEIYEKNRNIFGIAAIYNNLSTTYIKKGMYQDALKKINDSNSLLKKAKDIDDLSLATILNNNGLVYELLSEYKKALDYYNRALEIYKNKFDYDHPEMITIYKNIGNINADMGLLSEAQNYYQKASDIANTYYEKDGYFIADIYNAMGVAYDNAGSYNESREYFLKALSIINKISGDKSIFATILYNNLGRMYYRIGQFDNALTYQHKSIDILETFFKDNEYELAIPYDTIGITYSELGNFEKALFYQEKALKINLKIYGENHLNVAISYNDIGLTYLYKGEYEKALDYYKKSVEIKLKFSDENNPSIATGYNNIALAYTNLEKFNESIDYYLRALKIYKNTFGNDHPYTARAYNNLALSYFMLREYKKSKDNFLKAIEITEKNREKFIGSSKSKAELFSTTLHIYKLMVSTLYHLNEYNDAFYYLEKSKSRSLLDDLSRNIIFQSPEIDKEIQNKLLNKKYEIIALDNIIITKKESGLNFSEEEKELFNSQRYYEKIFNEILKKYPKFEKITKPKISKLEEVQSILEKNEIVIEYSIYDESYVFLVTNQSLDILKLDIDKEKLFNYIDAYRDLIIKKKKNFYLDPKNDYLYSDRGLKIKKEITKNSRGLQKQNLNDINYTEATKIINDYLYEKLFSIVIPYIKDKTEIKIIPDANLSFLPFESLKNKDNTYLIELFNISYIQSSSILVLTRERKSKYNLDLLAFGGAIYSDENKNADDSYILDDKEIDYYKTQQEMLLNNQGNLTELYKRRGYLWGNLPGTKEEVDEIGKFYYKKESKLFTQNILTGKNVAEENIIEMNKNDIFKKFRIIHFATHGLFDIEVPELSAIILSIPENENNKEDGYLTLPEIMNLDLNSDLVTLSACETGLGRIISGEGVIGLTQSFLIAGSKNVIVSLWKVSDEATKDFMISFYKKIKDGESYKNALKETKIEFIKGKWKDSYYWAPFIIFGE